MEIIICLGTWPELDADVYAYSEILKNMEDFRKKFLQNCGLTYYVFDFNTKIKMQTKFQSISCIIFIVFGGVYYHHLELCNIQTQRVFDFISFIETVT